MSRRSPARRLLGLLGVVLLIGGIVAAVVLFVLGPRYSNRQVDQLARGAVGCVTPLVFTETGTFYVYQEVAGPDRASSGCPANPQPGDFAVTIAGPSGPVALADDRSASYNSGGAVGTSIRRFEVTELGVYDMTVNGPDAGIRAAVGPDPDEIVNTYRTWALIGGLSGVIVGLILLVGSSVGGTRRQTDKPEPVLAAPPLAGEPLVRPANPWGAPSADDRRG
ncbi:MAG TPA: hypothetical protein VNQ73_13980 [Ilumatobacter sp.]|nr:hypothetical protein [Ilumatobacter sp.]